MLQRRAEFPTVDDAFGHWLAGFIDGEGTFLIGQHTQALRRPRRDGGHYCMFAIVLRRDDAALIEECRRRTGLGVVVYPKAKYDYQNPTVRWAVKRKRDVVRLCEVLDACPLRSKRARDFAIWRQGVSLWLSVRPGRGTSRSQEAQSQMKQLKRQLEEGRQYRDGPEMAEVRPGTQQLTLAQ